MKKRTKKRIKAQYRFTNNLKLGGCNHCHGVNHLTLDHIVPKSFRFLKRPIFSHFCKINQQILCLACNYKKDNKIYYWDIIKRPRLLIEILRRMSKVAMLDWGIIKHDPRKHDIFRKIVKRTSPKWNEVGRHMNHRRDIVRSNLKAERVMVNKLIADEILAHLKQK